MSINRSAVSAIDRAAYYYKRNSEGLAMPGVWNPASGCRMRALISFTLQRHLCANVCRAQLLGYSPQPPCSGRPSDWFHIQFVLFL